MTDASLAERFFTDAMSPDFREDPYPYYDSYRRASGLMRLEATIWMTMAHGDVTGLLRHPKLSTNETRATTEIDRPQPGAIKSRSLLFMDPPDHTRLRALVSRAFTPRRVEELRQVTGELADGLVTDLFTAAGGGPVDAIGGLAYPLPMKVICRLLGVPDADEERLSAWSRDLTRGLDPSVLRDEATNAAITVAESELGAYIAELIELRRAAPGDDLLSGLLAVESEGDRITTQEVVDLAVLLLVAGHETTVNLIGNGLLGLLGRPDQLELLRSGSAPEGWVDELLRFDSPVQMTQRIATEDLDLLGETVREGDEIILVLGAANRDPSAFPDPGRVDLRRTDSRRHVAFGGGIHHCLGAALARMEGEIALRTLARRSAHIALAAPPTRRPHFTLRGLATLPVQLG